MFISTLKQFIRPTLPKISLTIALIVLFILGRRMVFKLESPTEHIFFKMDRVIFMPGEFVANIFSNHYSYIGNTIYFIVDLAEYYLLACLLIFLFHKIRFGRTTER